MYGSNIFVVQQHKKLNEQHLQKVDAQFAYDICLRINCQLLSSN